MNKYELSRKPQCQLKATKQKPQKKCDDAPSYRCQKFFNEHSSPLAQYFDIVDPEPFWDACIEDTKPCGKKVNFNAYCKSVSAFVSFANAIGQYPEYPESCGKSLEIYSKRNFFNDHKISGITLELSLNLTALMP